MINDNLGILIAKLIRPPSSGNLFGVSGFKDISGVAQNLDLYGLVTAFTFNDTNQGATTSQTQVGDGATPPTRQQTNIDSPFSNGGVEDGRVANTNIGYNSGLGKIDIPTNFTPTAGSGTIKEVCKFMAMSRAIGGQGIFMIFRDLTPDTSFIAGKTINVVHEVLI